MHVGCGIRDRSESRRARPVSWFEDDDAGFAGRRDIGNIEAIDPMT